MYGRGAGLVGIAKIAIFLGVDCSVSCGMKDRLTAIRGMCERILEAQSTVIEIVLIQKSTIAFAVAKSD